jgi:hypothetical protein
MGGDRSSGSRLFGVPLARAGGYPVRAEALLDRLEVHCLA